MTTVAKGRCSHQYGAGPKPRRINGKRVAVLSRAGKVIHEADQHHSVSERNPEQGNEANCGRHRDRQACQPESQRAPRQSQRNIEQYQNCRFHSPECDEQDEEHNRQRNWNNDSKARIGLLLQFKLAAPHKTIPRRQVKLAIR